MTTPDPERPFEPDWASPPGATITDLMFVRGVTRAKLASQLGIDLPEVDKLLSGERHMTACDALGLEEVFTVPVSFWCRLEAQYRKTLKRLEHKAE